MPSTKPKTQSAKAEIVQSARRSKDKSLDNLFKTLPKPIVVMTEEEYWNIFYGL